MTNSSADAVCDQFHVLLVEDDKLWAQAFALSLNGSSRFTITNVPDLAAARATLLDSRPPFDVVVIDPGLPDGYGIDLVTELVASHPELALAVVTGRWDDGIVNDTLRARADAFARKPLEDGGPTKLVYEALVNARVRQSLTIDGLQHPHVSEPRLPAPLTEAECRAVRLRLAGHSYRTIADSLGLSHETVKSHIKAARAKLYARKGEDLRQAIRRYQLGISS